MTHVKTLALTAALVAGTAASALAGTITETSRTWQPGFYADDAPIGYTRTVEVDYDTGYKAGSARVVKTVTSNLPFDGAAVDENGYEKVVVDFDPSQVATASAGEQTAKPAVVSIWQPGYAADDNGSYYLTK